MNRYLVLDKIRGFTLISMLAYHTIWDLVYIFGLPWLWYSSPLGFLWQQSICWSFILLSGFCWSFGRRKLKRGLIVFLAGGLVTAATVLFMPESRVVFGVLSLLGSCMLLMIPLEKLLKKCKALPGLACAFALFALSYHVNQGYLGFFGLNLYKLPQALYSNLLTSYLGFPPAGFYSSDYFSLFPWLFLFITGYFLHRIFESRALLPKLKGQGSSILSWLGQKSLPVYLLHQPLIYGLLYLIFSL